MTKTTTKTTPKRAGKNPANAPTPVTTTIKSVGGKLGAILDLLKRPQGATIAAMMAATGWQAHSVRGAISGALKKDRKLAISSEPAEGGRVYRVTGEARA